MLVATYAVILGVFVLSWGKGRDRALLWACVAITDALFMLPTRIHERYLFPTIVFGTLLVALAPRLRWLYVAISLTLVINLYYVCSCFFAILKLPLLYDTSLVVYGVSLVNVLLLLYLLCRALPVLYAAKLTTAAERASSK